VGRGAIAYKWDLDGMVWEEIGQVVGKPKKRPTVDGVAYDHVTDVFVDAERSVQLGFNKDDDPDEVAHLFCSKWNLPVTARSQIVEHLRPLCDKEAYKMRQLNEERIKEVTSLRHVPAWKSGGFTMFAPIKSKAFHSKVLELSAGLGDKGLKEEQIKTLGTLVKTLADTLQYQGGPFSKKEGELVRHMIATWPPKACAPVLDAIRALMVHSNANVFITNDGIIMNSLLDYAAQGTKTHKLLVLKAVANWVAKRERSPCERSSTPTIPAQADAFLNKALEVLAGCVEGDVGGRPSGAKESMLSKLQEAYVMLACNIMTWLGRMAMPHSDLYLVLAAALVEALGKQPKDKVVFYCLLTLGTVGHCSQSAKELVKASFGEELVAIIRRYRVMNNQAVKEVCEDVVRVFTLSV